MTGCYCGVFRRQWRQWRRRPVLLRLWLQLSSPPRLQNQNLLHLRLQLWFRLLPLLLFRLRLQLQLTQEESVSASVKVTMPWTSCHRGRTDCGCRVWFWLNTVCVLVRCGRADHSGSADRRLWGGRGALSPWQPDGRQHHPGHRRRSRALRENPEEVFHQNTQQDNQGDGDKEKFTRRVNELKVYCWWCNCVFVVQLISAVVMKDWHDVLNTCELQNWKEALAAVMTYAQPEEFSSLCGQCNGKFSQK